jgi:SanA protein
MSSKKRSWPWWKIIISSAFFLAVILLATIIICNKVIANASEGKLYSDPNAIPYNRVGLLLGTTRHVVEGQINPYYQFRIDAAVSLFRHNKIKYVIVSGDNSRNGYNEPEDMRRDLINAGVDSTKIFLDYAGLRTFDSMVRLREIFGQDSVTVISQAFHNERALYIASRENITAIGFNAQDVSARAGMKTQLREKLARVKVFVDYLTAKKPRHLGEKVAIPE